MFFFFYCSVDIFTNILRRTVLYCIVVSIVVWYLQQLRVVSAQLLQQGWQEGWVLLNDLSHLLKLRLVPQKFQRVP